MLKISGKGCRFERGQALSDYQLFILTNNYYINLIFITGARVIMACRNEQKAQEAVDDIKKTCGNKENLGELVVVPLDLSSLNSVRKCAQQLLEKEKRIDLLINNAGIMMCPYGKTEDGFEMQLGTNHLGHFLLTLLLLPKIIENPPARIVTVSSMANKSK